MHLQHILKTRSNQKCLLFLSPEPAEASPSGQGAVSLLCANPPGTALHVVLRERKDDHEASWEHGGGGVRLSLIQVPENLSVKGQTDWSRWAVGPEEPTDTDLSCSEAQSGWRSTCTLKTEAAAALHNLREGNCCLSWTQLYKVWI